MVKKIHRIIDYFNHIIIRIDAFPLWWIGLVLVLVLLLPNLVLGEGSVFPIHDQLDESMMNYVLTSRHMGQEQIPEILGGVSAGGMQPAAVLFLPLYRIFPAFSAFLIMYVTMLLAGFVGMYLCVRELTESSILAVWVSGCFCMLPLYSIYGLSMVGLPLTLFVALRLSNCKAPSVVEVILYLMILVVFALSSHLVCTGYVVLAFWAMGMLIALLKKRLNRWSCAGFGVLLLTYLIVNARLFIEVLFGKSLGSQEVFVSHREEMVNYAQPFWTTVKEVFLESAQHAPAHHKGLILPTVILLVIGAIFYKRLGQGAKQRYHHALLGFAILIGVAVFYGVCKSELVVSWKNGLTGFLRYFQAERFYWIYPAGWYLEFALVCSWTWTAGKQLDGVKNIRHFLFCPLFQFMAIGIILFPTAKTVFYDSDFYRNVNQYNNGTQVTGYITWESYYADDLMTQIEKAIGREMQDYKIAHLGISPAPALMHGFYTVDGYSNNYPLAYKHAFRQVIEGELDKAPETAAYFDTWGSRCYLFNSQTGTYWMMKKGSGVVYQDLDFNMNALSSLGCEYILSGGEIVDPEDMGIELMDYFETEKAYWGIWLYKLQ